MVNKKSQDKLYSTPHNTIKDFVFDEKVAGVFDDMITRSVPGYDDIEKMIGVLAERYVKEGSNLYDLGCSLGRAALSMQKYIDKPNCKIIAIDNSEAMIKRCKESLNKETNQTTIEFICGDVCNVDIKKASVVVMNFVLQFLEPGKRFEILRGIYSGFERK